MYGPLLSGVSPGSFIKVCQPCDHANLTPALRFAQGGEEDFGVMTVCRADRHYPKPLLF